MFVGINRAINSNLVVHGGQIWLQYRFHKGQESINTGLNKDEKETAVLQQET